MEDNTEHLRVQTEPLRIPNPHNHCVTPTENSCEGPMLIRVSHIWKITQNHFVGRLNHCVYPTPTTTV